MPSIIHKIKEHFSVAEEIIAGYNESDVKCKAVEKAVGENYLSLPEALTAYNITQEAYYEFIIKNLITVLRELRNQKTEITDENGMMPILHSILKFMSDHKAIINPDIIMGLTSLTENSNIVKHKVLEDF